MGSYQKRRGKRKKNTVSAICMGGGAALEGSYTVEASVVMAVVLLAMVTLLQAAYRQCRMSTGIMRTHQMVEILRHKEEDKPEPLVTEGGSYEIEVKRAGDKVTGTIRGDGWKRVIQQTVFEPEAFMRMLTLVQE